MEDDIGLEVRERREGYLSMNSGIFVSPIGAGVGTTCAVPVKYHHHQTFEGRCLCTVWAGGRESRGVPGE
jgi:hypothetical protein